jgi:hypothetical protein
MRLQVERHEAPLYVDMMGDIGVSISMLYTDMNNIMAAMIQGLVTSEGALVALKMLLHRLLARLGLRGFPVHLRQDACVPCG